MIRIKCPKCAFSLALDDDEAGEVGECTECGARFRVPKPKAAAAAARSRPGQEAKRRPPARGNDEDDEDDDDLDDEMDDDEPKRKPKIKGKAKQQQAAMSGAELAVLICVWAAIILSLGVAGIFINKLAFFVTALSIFVMEACALMVARLALSESGLTFMMILVIPPYFIFYSVSNWSRTQQYFSTYCALLILTTVGAGAFWLNGERTDAQRKATKDKIMRPAMLRVEPQFRA